MRGNTEIIGPKLNEYATQAKNVIKLIKYKIISDLLNHNEMALYVVMKTKQAPVPKTTP